MKTITMDWNDINRELVTVNEIIIEWREGAPMLEIDKDLVLEKLRMIYQQVKFEVAPTVIPESNPVLRPEPVVTIEVIESIEIPEEHNANAETEVSKARIDRKTLLSLYDDCKESHEKSEAVADQCTNSFENTISKRVSSHSSRIDDIPAEMRHDLNEQGKVLGEVIGNTGQTIGEAYASHNDMADIASAISSGRLESLRKSIGINDKFLIIRDMFASDSIAFEETIDTLESFDNLDDAMVYIYENYTWNPNDEGVKLLVDLLMRKLS